MFQKMRKSAMPKSFLLLSVVLFLSVYTVSGQYQGNKSEVYFYEKNELNFGLQYEANSEREQLLTDFTKEYEEMETGFVKFQFKNNYWNFLDSKQEHIKFNFEVGPLWGNGNWMDSTQVENIEADHKVFGLRTNASIDYLQRYYYSNKNYTLVQVDGWARYDIYQQNSKGSSTDSNDVVTFFDEKTNESELRYGFQAKAGWGWGRLNPMNHYMVAEYLLNKYYEGRNFSEEEIRKFADVIAELKHQRNLKTEHKIDVEAGQIKEFLNKKMLLTVPDNLDADWQGGEFLPRYNGGRVEGGPFFQYYNREPDFVYGGYIQYENSKYSSYKWNRNFSANLNYNRYKKQDWILAELDFGWSYFPDLKNQWDFGLRYIPGIVVNGFKNMESLNHGFIPYLGYFSQINAKTRVNIAMALRISEDEKILLPGPEFSISIYRSRY